MVCLMISSSHAPPGQLLRPPSTVAGMNMTSYLLLWSCGGRLADSCCVLQTPSLVSAAWCWCCSSLVSAMGQAWLGKPLHQVCCSWPRTTGLAVLIAVNSVFTMTVADEVYAWPGMQVADHVRCMPRCSAQHIRLAYQDSTLFEWPQHKFTAD